MTIEYYMKKDDHQEHCLEENIPEAAYNPYEERLFEGALGKSIAIGLLTLEVLVAGYFVYAICRKKMAEEKTSKKYSSSTIIEDRKR